MRNDGFETDEASIEAAIVKSMVKMDVHRIGLHGGVIQKRRCRFSDPGRSCVRLLPFISGRRLLFPNDFVAVKRVPSTLMSVFKSCTT